MSWAVAAATLASMHAPASAELVFGVTNRNSLVSWDRSTPGTIAGTVQITGLVNGDSVEGIDFRPADGQLYGIGSGNRMYQINITTGQATLVGDGFTPVLNGGHFGFDFNPVVDLAREVSNANQNQRLSPLTGDVFSSDGDLFYADGDARDGRNPQIVHIAYSNNFDGAATTVLYGLDSKHHSLVTISPPNDGELQTIGDLGFKFKQLGGFDIATLDGAAFAALDSDGAGAKSCFYQINLATGEATLIGEIGNGHLSIRAMAIAIPGPSALLALACGLLLLGSRRRFFAH
jgi:hypothetical protein